MENVINKPCLCQLEQAICCLPKPLSEQRKQIFLVERGAESPTGADWSCVLSSTIPLHLPLLESVGKQSTKKAGYFSVWTTGECALPASDCRAAKRQNQDGANQTHACKQTPYVHLCPPVPSFPYLLAESNSVSCSGEAQIVN